MYFSVNNGMWRYYMSIQKSMNWIYKNNKGENVAIDDFLSNLDRGKSLVLLKVIENIEEKFKLSLSEEELKKLTALVENTEDGSLRISLSGSKDIISKVVEKDNGTKK